MPSETTDGTHHDFAAGLPEQAEPTAGRHVNNRLPTGGRWDADPTEGILNLAIGQ
jgi:hypothetical protein